MFLVGLIGYGFSVLLLAVALGCIADAARARRSPTGRSSDGWNSDQNMGACLGFAGAAFVAAVVTAVVLRVLA